MRNRTGWQYAASALALAALAAVISYRDGLFVARLAGNHDGQAYLYPFLPDGLIIISLLALYEASRARVSRSRWAVTGLVLGIALTLAQNVYAGWAHSLLDAVLDGMVPVVFYIAVEVVLWHVRRSRPERPINRDFSSAPGAVPSDVLAAAKASMAATAAAGNPLSRNQLQERFRLPRSVAAEVWAPYRPVKESPAGSPTPPAGASGRGAVPPGVPAALNGNARGHG